MSDIPGAGAAGGLAGGLVALGGRIVEGFDVVAEETCLAERLDGADLVVTGEGRADAESFNGKVLGGVCGLADRLGVPVLAIAGEVDAESPPPIPVLSLTDRFGPDEARAEPAACVEQLVTEQLEL